MSASAPSPRLASHLVLLALLPVAVFAIWVGALVWLIGSLATTAEWVDHTDQVLAAASGLESRAFGEVVAVRGFLVTRSDTFLRAYPPRDEFERALKALQALVRDNPGQQRRVVAFGDAWRAWREVADEEISLSRKGADPGPLLLEKAEPLERSLRTLGEEMRAEEERLRVDRVERASTTRRRTLVGTTVVGLLLGVLLAALGVRELRRVAADYETTH